MSLNSIGNMNNLERWVYGLPQSDIVSYEALKQEVYEHAKRDYVFFPFLIGYVKRYLKEDIITENVRNCVYQVLYDLLIENKISVLFVSATTLKACQLNSINDIKKIIEKIRLQWEALGLKEVEINEIIWITNMEL